MLCDSFNQGVNIRTVIDMIERIDELIAWDHDKQREKGMVSVKCYSANFYGKASDLLEHLRNPEDKNIRKATTKIGIVPTPYNPSKEQEGVVEKGLWSVHGLRQSESEEHRTMGISVCIYDSDNNIESTQTGATPRDPEDPKGYMTSGVMLEAIVVIAGKSKVAVLKIDAVDLTEFKRWVNLQKEGGVALRMDEIEN